MTDAQNEGGERGSPFACLCCVCGHVSLAIEWTYWQRTEDGEDWRPTLSGENDPMARCPACLWEHRDTDDGSGVYEGTLEEMREQQLRDAPEMGDLWATTLEERADALDAYGASLPEGVTTEAFAEASNLRREAGELRALAVTP